MQEIKVRRRSIDRKAIFRAPPREEDVSVSVSLPCRIVDAETGALLAVALAGEPSMNLARKLDRIKFGNPMSGGRRLAGYSQGAAMTFGFLPKRPIQTQCQVCRSAAIYRSYPWLADELTAQAQKAWALLGEANLDRQVHLLERGKEILPEWKITGTGFTSGIINKNTPLRYHYDAGNFQTSWSAMLWLANGIQGGALAFPEYDAKILLEDGAWLFFSGQSILHGVTPIKMLSKQSYRYSLVFYANAEMRNCGTMEQELADAKKRRTISEQKERAVR